MEELKRHQTERTDDGLAIANNKTLKYSCYLGHLKPKHVPSDYKSKRLDEKTLIATLQKFAPILKKKRHGMVLSMIRSGFFGNGHEKMTPEEYTKILEEHNISVSCSRSTFYDYIRKEMDLLSYSIDIEKFDDDILSLTDKENNRISKINNDIKICSMIIDDYWQKMA